jgi:hypothetical protein
MDYLLFSIIIIRVVLDVMTTFKPRPVYDLLYCVFVGGFIVALIYRDRSGEYSYLELTLLVGSIVYAVRLFGGKLNARPKHRNMVQHPNNRETGPDEKRQ